MGIINKYLKNSFIKTKQFFFIKNFSLPNNRHLNTTDGKNKFINYYTAK